MWMLFVTLAAAQAPPEQVDWMASMDSTGATFASAWSGWLDPESDPPAPPVDLHLQRLRDRRTAYESREQMLLSVTSEQSTLVAVEATRTARRAALVTSLDEWVVQVHQRRLDGTTRLTELLGEAGSVSTEWETAFELCLEGDALGCARADRLWTRVQQRADGEGQGAQDAAGVLALDAHEERLRASQRRGITADATAEPAGVVEQLEGEIARTRADADALDAEIARWLEEHGAPPPDPRLVGLRGLADQFLALAQASPLEPVQISSTRWCQLWVHGGATLLLLEDPQALAWLRTAAGARDGVCRGTAAPLLELPSFAAAWGEANLDLSYGEGAILRIAVGEGAWRVDGVSVVGRDVEDVRLRPGPHRVEREGDFNTVSAHEEEVRGGEVLGVWFDGSGILMQPLIPGSTTWGWTHPSSSVVQGAEPSTTTVTADSLVDPRAAHLSIAPVVGVSFDHGQWFGNVGGAALVEPGWPAHLGFTLGVTVAVGEAPLWLSRFESETRLFNAQVGVRWTPLLGRTLSPYVQLGGYLEPGITGGPVGAVGGSLRLPRVLFDVGVAVPYSVPDRLGHWNVEMYLSPRFLLPLRLAPRRGQES